MGAHPALEFTLGCAYLLFCRGSGSNLHFYIESKALPRYSSNLKFSNSLIPLCPYAMGTCAVAAYAVILMRDQQDLASERPDARAA